MGGGDTKNIGIGGTGDKAAPAPLDDFNALVAKVPTPALANHELRLSPAASPEEAAHRRVRDLRILSAAFVAAGACILVCTVLVLCRETYDDEERKAALAFLTNLGTALVGFVIGRSTTSNS